MDARAESNDGLESIGARSAVDFEVRDSGRNGEGRRGGGIYGRVVDGLSENGPVFGWKGVDGVGGSGRGVSAGWFAEK